MKLRVKTQKSALVKNFFGKNRYFNFFRRNLNTQKYVFYNSDHTIDIYVLYKVTILFFIKLLKQFPMGNSCFSNQNMPPFKQKDPKAKGLVLNVEIQTWLDQVLPNIRQSANACKTSLYCTKDSFLVSDQFSEIKQLQKEPLISKNQLVINVQKHKANSFKLTPNLSTVYKLLNSSLQLELGYSFVIGTTQYKLIKHQTGKDCFKKEIKSVIQMQSSRVKEIKSRNCIKTLQQVSQILIQQPCCRICMMEQDQYQEDNPLVSPCDCIGSMQYIHVKCWMQWAFKRTNKTDDYFITHILKQVCQICKKNLLESQVYKQIITTLLVSQSKIEPPFIILEGQSPMQKNKYVSYKMNYIVISFKNKNNFVLGRGLKQGIPLVMDVSISRTNTQIYLQNNQIFVKDIGSKHGTFQKLDSSIIVKANEEPQIYCFKNSLIKLSAKNNK